jgi:hypothetical protein
MKRRHATLGTLVVAILLGVGLFITSEKVQQAERDLKIIQQRVAAERDTLRVLRAEWTYLNRPERLEQLANLYLTLTPALADARVGTLDHVAAATRMMTTPRIKPAIAKANNIPPAASPTALAPQIIKATNAPTKPKARPAKPVDNSTFYQMMSRTAPSGGHHDR